ncbi:hypothetical protein MUN81_10835 [Hymenobacter sp. 5317J-9]|uniref:DUF6728 family protein n=2 Tax=Hymenobacteraceae TaxID=1853232 RepID=UPI001FD6FE8D|nr:DUF6728 family protein [Hymenobacter sp. 5317J-9]UOR00111.1 hypothetical protein MUN81_10835 [Hymenobacter sp. 5317J-9]
MNPRFRQIILALGVLSFRTQTRPAMNGKNLFNFGPALGYFFRGNDPNRKTNFNLKTMHFINKLSLAMFLVCLVVMLFRYVL